jgi:hypothetical protein
MKKERWSKKYAVKKKFGKPETPRFRYEGDGSGKFVFYRGFNRFAWAPIECTRDEANAFVYRLNQITGRDIERVARPITEAFKAKHTKTEKEGTE